MKTVNKQIIITLGLVLTVVAANAFAFTGQELAGEAKSTWNRPGPLPSRPIQAKSPRRNWNMKIVAVACAIPSIFKTIRSYRKSASTPEPAKFWKLPRKGRRRNNRCCG